MATVHETNYEYFAQDDFRVRKPDIKIKVGFEFLFQNSTSRCYARRQLITQFFCRDFMKYYFNFLIFFKYNDLSRKDNGGGSGEKFIQDFDSKNQ
jgi:hypothetical protein